MLILIKRGLMEDIKERWNRIFRTTPYQHLGWYENDFNHIKREG